MIVITGMSCSGKDTVLNKILEHDNTLEPIVSYTTRPMRKGETNGKDYFFVSEEYFKYLIENNKLQEYRRYKTVLHNKKEIWYYGTLNSSYQKNSIVILDFEGYLTIKDDVEGIFPVYINVDFEERTRRAKKRGSFCPIEWERREREDLPKFDLNVIDKDFLKINDMSIEQASLYILSKHNLMEP